jgi:hypothetical protein
MSLSSFGISVVDSGTKAGDAPLIPISLFRRVYSFHEIIDCAAAREFLTYRKYKNRFHLVRGGHRRRSSGRLGDEVSE